MLTSFFQKREVPDSTPSWTKIKLCGLMCEEDILTANELLPDLIGFVFAKKSRRYVSPETAAAFRKLLRPEIPAVGVFVNEAPEQVASLLRTGTIQAAQLHGTEDEAYIAKLRTLTEAPIFQAFRIDTKEAVKKAAASSADGILVDSGTGGTGTAFDWSFLTELSRPFFLAGGLTLSNIEEALKTVSPFGVDVSSGIETDGKKDAAKMREFVRLVRNYSQLL